MNPIFISLIKEEAEHLGYHYFSDFIGKAKDNKVNFETHYHYLNFDKKFFTDIIYTNQELLESVSNHKLSVFKDTKSEIIAEKENKKYLKQFTKDVEEHFKKQFALTYLERLNDEIADIKEDLKYAIEDDDYHVHRRYIGQEDVIGGPVSEEERKECIKEAKEKQETFNKQLQQLEGIKQELLDVINEESVLVS